MAEKTKYKILLVNKFYYQRGGDCIQMMSVERLLKEHGHQVAVFSMQYPQNIKSEYSRYFVSNVNFAGGLKHKTKAIGRILGLGDVRSAYLKILDDFKPDIVHLHNIHSYISPIVAKLAKERGCRVVWTLHDYKLVCPSYRCLSAGKPCEACFTDKMAVIKNRCMKGGISASILAYIEAKVWNIKRLCKYTDVFICPSSFMATMVLKSGIEENKIVTLCNFVDDEKLVLTDNTEREDYYCYVGRLSEEKGVRTLLKATSELPYILKIAGDGPIFAELKLKYASDNIQFLGQLDSSEVRDLLVKARCSVIPSEWNENNPLSVIESLCMGTPVLGANIGGIPELINKENGLLYEPGNKDLLKKRVTELFCDEMFDHQKIKNSAINLFNSGRYYDALKNIYKQSIPIQPTSIDNSN